MGAKHQPSYRVVVADARSPRDGRFVDQVGYYNPLTDPATYRVNAERAQYWVDHGAQATEAAARAPPAGRELQALPARWPDTAEGANMQPPARVPAERRGRGLSDLIDYVARGWSTTGRPFRSA
jgi:small subunit ribosomal protein S16